MTNYEKIKGMSITQMAELLVPNNDRDITDDYCGSIYPFTDETTGKCMFDECTPCGELSYTYMTLAWLVAEAK